MNRENKRRTFQSDYYRNHPCDETFTCKECGREVVPSGAGSAHRNHCPNCLTSLHVDESPGDRASDCGGQMEPAFAEPDPRRGYIITHRCTRCGALRRNKAAAEAKVQPDDLSLLIALTAKDFEGTADEVKATVAQICEKFPMYK